jgi:DNA-binding MarR family transcriptional regulator
MSSKKELINLMESWASTYLFHSITDFFNYLKLADLSLLQAYALTYVFYRGPSKISDLCEHMMVSPAAASQMVDRLEKQNLVTRISQPGDRRVRNVVLSVEGESFVQRSIAARQSWIEEIPSRLTDEQQKQVSESLKVLISLFKENRKFAEE